MRIPKKPSTTLALLLLLAACGGGDEPEGGGGEGLQPVRGGRLTVAVSGEPDALNPLTRTTAVAGDVLGICNRGLAAMDRDFEFVPAIARRWEFSDDGLTLSYHLRSDVLWSDGEPFSSRDVVLSYELYTDPEVASPRASNFADVDSVYAPDDSTVVFEFSGRSRDQVFNTTYSLLPAHIVAGLDPAQVRQWPINRAPVTLGPFRVREWVAGDRVVMERNPHYYGEPAWLDEVVFKVVPDESSRLLQLANGEVDMVEQIPYPEISTITERNPQVRLYTLDGRNTGYIAYNTRREPFGDARIRNAISYAIDRRAIIDGLMYGHAAPIASPIPPLLGWAHHEGLVPHRQDLERSRRLLEEAGWVDGDGDGIREKDGRPFTLELKTRTGDPVREYGAVIIQRNLREVGIEATNRLMELGTVLEQVRDGDFDLYLGMFRARLSVDPTNTFGTGGSFNHGGYSNPEVDSLIAAGLAELDRDLARPIWQQVQEILHDEQPWSLLYLQLPVTGIHERFRDCTPHALSLYEDIEEWWMVPPPPAEEGS